MNIPRYILTILWITIFFGCGSIDKQNTPEGSSYEQNKIVDSDKSKVNINKPLKEQYAFIESIHQKNDTTIVDADYIQYLTGQAAIDAAIKVHEADTFRTADGEVHVDIANDYFILNENQKITSLVLDKNCVFDLITDQDRTPRITDNSFANFLKAFKDSPFILTLNDENIIIGIKEVFIP